MRSVQGLVPGLVSVVIPAYNAELFVAEAVTSALNQDYRNVEVLVTNDGSRDGTAKILSRFGAAVRVVNQANAGLQAARNAAVRVARGQYVAFLDADDVWRPDKIRRQVGLMQESPDCVMVHTAVSWIDRSGQEVARALKPWHTSPFRGRCSADLIRHNTVVVSSVLVRAANLDTDPFRPFSGCEDWDLWLRLSSSAPVAYLDEKLTCYRIHDANMSSNAARMTQSSISVLAAFVRESSDATLKAVATQERRSLCRALANHHFDRGDYRAARTWFAQAGWPMRVSDAQRWVGCWLPRPLIAPARRIGQALRFH